eukprot:2727507-Rhodomonas_salina.6
MLASGYRVLFLTSAPITRADRVRDTVRSPPPFRSFPSNLPTFLASLTSVGQMNAIRQAEVQQWGRGASVPASPIMTSQVCQPPRVRCCNARYCASVRCRGPQRVL